MTAIFPTGRRDFVEAASDFIRIRAGLAPRMPHPYAERMAESQITLRDLASQITELDAQAGSLHAKSALARANGAVAYGVSSSDFNTMLSNVVRAAVERSYDLNLPEIKRATIERDIQDFKPVEVGAGVGVDFDNGTFNGELQPIRTAKMNAFAGEKIQLMSYAVRLNVPRNVLVNDDLLSLVDAIKQVVAALERRERDAIVGPFLALNTNQGDGLTLADGAPMFSVAAKSLVTGNPSISATALNAALVALAGQKVPGTTEVAELRPRFILVNPSDELNARGVLRDSGLDGVLEVVVTSGITPNIFVVLADPSKAPVLMSARLTGSQRPVTGFLQKANPRSDGLASAVVYADFGAAPISRFGVVASID